MSCHGLQLPTTSAYAYPQVQAPKRTLQTKSPRAEREDTVTFGDDQNDIEMLKLCGKGIAVANAVPEALEAADEVTLSNDEDGVARWLTEHC